MMAESIHTPQSQHDFKIADAGSYDSVVASFGDFTDRLSPPLADRIVRQANVRPTDEVLDVGTGTGILALRAAQAIGPQGSVLGVDLSREMLARASKKADLADLGDRLQFRQMDAEALDLPSESFDVVVSLYALLHFPDALVALGEMYRVLRPGGRLVLGVGSGPPLSSIAGWRHRLRRLRELSLRITGRVLVAPQSLDRLIGSRLGASDCPEEAPLPRAHRNRSRAVPQLVRRAGFRHVRTYWEGHVAQFDSPEEFWELQRTFSSVVRKRLQMASPAEVNALREQYLQRCRAVRARRGQLLYPYAALITSAERP